MVFPQQQAIYNCSNRNNTQICNLRQHCSDCRSLSAFPCPSKCPKELCAATIMAPVRKPRWNAAQSDHLFNSRTLQQEVGVQPASLCSLSRLEDFPGHRNLC